MIECLLILRQDCVIEIYESGSSTSSPHRQINHLRAASHHWETFPFDFAQSTDIVFGYSSFPEGQVEYEEKESNGKGCNYYNGQ